MTCWHLVRDAERPPASFLSLLDQRLRKTTTLREKEVCCSTGSKHANRAKPRHPARAVHDGGGCYEPSRTCLNVQDRFSTLLRSN
jgi:hypothetical protein